MISCSSLPPSSQNGIVCSLVILSFPSYVVEISLNSIIFHLAQIGSTETSSRNTPPLRICFAHSAGTLLPAINAVPVPSQIWYPVIRYAPGLSSSKSAAWYTTGTLPKNVPISSPSSGSSLAGIAGHRLRYSPSSSNPKGAFPNSIQFQIEINSAVLPESRDTKPRPWEAESEFTDETRKLEFSRVLRPYVSGGRNGMAIAAKSIKKRS